ncbi:MAG: 4Fe-4S dicluster domain-containing protein [Candidatus Aminicenantes bacterium]|nr:4Fe-4S dicluster domain-containing protein [Candidatus Aminicenantes bacterium]
MPKKEDVYKRLARHLDDLPAGFPPSESGVELRLLKRLFTEDEAEMALLLSVFPEAPESVATRSGLSLEETARRLEEMSLKGLIHRRIEENGRRRYSANQYVIGIWEYQVNRLNPELIRDMEEYLPTLMTAGPWKDTPQLRVIPVNEKISVRHEILAHERAEEMVRGQERFLVAPCICRRERRMVGQGCDKPEEACLIMGGAVDYYEANGMGRVIGRDEALALLKTADDAGLVLQPSNAKKIANICMCCGCCCGVLRAIKAHPRPAEFVSAPFRAALAPETCEDCGVCLKRCPMGALGRDAEKRVRLEAARCIGCGLCVTTCPSGSLTLVRKPEAEQRDVPATFRQTYVEMAKRRGKIKPAKLAKAWLRTKIKAKPQ